MTVNEALQDAALSHQVDLQQYTAHVLRRMLGVLNRADADLAAQLAAALERLPDGAFTVERLEDVLQGVRALNLRVYQALERELSEELGRFAAVEAGAQAGMLREALPVQVTFTQVSGEQAYAAAMARPFQGRLLREWAQGIEAERMTRIRDAVRMGFVEGEAIPQIVRRVRGTRVRGYADGIIEIDRRHAESVVRTAVSHVAGVVRDRFYEDNEDIIKAVAWTATLDGRTSDGCRIRDGKQYHPTTHKPLGHQIPWAGGPGRLHWRCRSSSVPVTKSWRELGLDADELDPGTRASMDGQVPADLTYGEWLKKQPASRQDQIVGATRGKLMREGKMPFDALYTNRGELLSLDELAERNAAAFRRAGVALPGA